MKQVIDRIGYSFIGLIILTMLEGIGTLGLAFQFDKYNLMGYLIQFMLVFLAVWFANKAYDAENDK